MALYRLTTEIVGREIKSFDFTTAPAANEAYRMACWIVCGEFPRTFALAPHQLTDHRSSEADITLRRVY